MTDQCTCYYHAPELHGPDGCNLLGCPCKWDGKLRPMTDQPKPMAYVQLLRDLRNLRAAVAGGSKINTELARMAKDWSKTRGLAVCNAIDAVDEELALLDAAIAKAES